MQWSTPQPKYLATPAHHGGHHHHTHSGNSNSNSHGHHSSGGRQHYGQQHHSSNQQYSNPNHSNTNSSGGYFQRSSSYDRDQQQQAHPSHHYNHHRAPSPVAGGGYNNASSYMNEVTTTPNGGYSPRVPGSAGRRSASKPKEYETDPHRLAQRQKQIMYGENTPGYSNFIKALERDPTLAQGCVPAKPSIVQKCSKRSWDGQVRKWRRALHMYDFVDFGTDAEESKRVQQALVQQTRNPVFRNRNPNGDEDAAPREVLANEYVRYTFDDMMALGDSPMIAQSVRLPESIAWLDKRVDLEDDIEDDDDFFINTTSSPGMKSPARFSSPMPSPVPSPARVVSSTTAATATRAPEAAVPASPVQGIQVQQPNNPSISPPAGTLTPLTPGKTPSPTAFPTSLSPLMARTTYAPMATHATVPVSVQLPNGQTAIALMPVQQVQQVQQAVAAGHGAPALFFAAPADATVQPQAHLHHQFCWSPPAADHRHQPLFTPTPQQQK